MALQKLLALALITLGFFFLLVYFGGKKLSTTDATLQTTSIEVPSPQMQNQDSTVPSPPPHTRPEPPGRFNQLDQWLTDNAGSMSSFSPQDRAALNDFVTTLQIPETKHLSRIAQNAQADGNMRVLSIYLIGKSVVGMPALTEFLNSEIPLKNNAAAHSVDETFNQKEKALRVMAVEQVVENAPSPQEAKRRLSQLQVSVKDSWLKGYISKRINELP